MPPTPEQLFERYRAHGDVDALGDLVDRTAPALLRVALHLSRDAQLAEDLVQETFLRAIEVAGQWDGTRPVTPWLIGILTNRARRRVRGEPDPERLRPAPDPADPRDTAEERELTEAVERGIAGLPAPYRPVLRLHLAYGHTPAEIAHALERPVGTVRSQLARGLEKLRRVLPAGFTSGIRAGHARGLIAVRTTVVDRATPTAPLPSPPAAATLSSIAAGPLIMKAVSGILAACALLALWVAWSDAKPDAPDAETEAGQPAARSGEVRRSGLESLSSTALRKASPDSQPQVDPDAEGSLLVRVRWRDSDPAVGVPVFVNEDLGHTSSFRRWRKLTDRRGEVRFSSLPVGLVRITSARDEFEFHDSVRIEPEEQASFDLELGGVTVTGQVVDDQDRPVPGAEVVAMATQNHLSPQVLATTDPFGRFELRAMGSTARLGARARGFAPSRMQKLPAVVGGEVAPLRIVLPGAGGGLLCTVRGPDGQLVEFARVKVRERPSGSGKKKGVQRRIQDTDSTGRVEFVGCSTGELDVLAWAEGLSPVRTTAHVVAGGRAELTIDLPAGVTLEGVVQDQSGRPVGDYQVSVGWSDTEAYKRFDQFAFQYAMTDALGRYRLSGLPAGEVQTKGSRAGRSKAEGLFHAVPGEAVRWDPVVDVGRSVSGRVLGPDGQGLKVIVEGSARGRRGWYAFEGTDEQGRFTLHDVDPELPIQIDVRELMFPMLKYDGPLPTEGELILRVPPEGMRTIHLRGRVVDSEGRPIPLAEVGVQPGGRGSAGIFPTDDEGRFDLGPYPSGDYRVFISAKNQVRHVYPTVSVAPEQTHDFGTLTMEPGGSLVVALQAEGELPGTPYVEAVHEDGTFGGRRGFEDGSSSFDSLRLGTYTVRVRGRGFATVEQAVVVDAGETRLEIDAKPATTVHIQLTSSTGAELPDRVRVRISDADRVAVLDAERKVRPDGRWQMGFFGLAPGSYRAEATLGDELLGTASFTVAGTDGEQTVPIPIR